MSNVKVETRFNPDLITQNLVLEDNHNLNLDISILALQIIDLKERGIREALISLGWTPPEDSKDG